MLNSESRAQCINRANVKYHWSKRMCKKRKRRGQRRQCLRVAKGALAHDISRCPGAARPVDKSAALRRQIQQLKNETSRLRKRVQQLKAERDRLKNKISKIYCKKIVP